jgi:transcriptional regulator with XRE-family HTH domain
MATSNAQGITDSGDLEAELLDGLDPEMRARVGRVRGFAQEVRRCLRRLRQERCNWSQRELADRIGVSTSTISRLENGRGFGGIDVNILALAFDAMDAAPRLTVLPFDDPAGWQVSDSPAQNGPAQPRQAGRTGGPDRGVREVAAVAASTGGGGPTESASELSLLRADVHALRAELDDLRRTLSAAQHSDSRRSTE